MGDETAASGCFVLSDGTAVPIEGLSVVEFHPDSDPTGPEMEWAGSFSLTAELDASGAIDALLSDPRPHCCCVEMEEVETERRPGPSRFMLMRRMWQLRRGRRNDADERRKLARKRSHLATFRRRLVFHEAVMRADFERNEVSFELAGGTALLMRNE